MILGLQGSLLGAVCLFLLSLSSSEAHMAIISPRARQVVHNLGLIQRSYTTFDSYPYGMNGNIFGGQAGVDFLREYGYDVCGDDPRRKAFTLPSSFGYAPTQPQMTIEAGKPFDVVVRFTTHHMGWMEFRVCSPPPGQTTVSQDTPACFKQHVLQLDAQQYYTAAQMPTGVRSVFDFEGTPEAGYSFHHAKCQQGPPGTCCDPNSGCSPENANVHRFMLPRDGTDNNDFKVRLIAPTDVTCDRCTLQVTYRTGNSPDSYPETFWNCADIAIVGGSTEPNPTKAPSTAPPTKATTTKAPSTAPPTKATTSKAPSTSPPTKATTTKAPTRNPTTKPPVNVPGGCSKSWEQCGGLGYTGPTCCENGDTCFTQNAYWSMCTPSNAIPPTPPPSLRPTAPPTKAGCANTWEQCGGQGFAGNTCCSSPNDICAFENEWWSMCKPK